jgi:riboflavin biosynthesis pyrimidine reductase
VRQLFPPPAGSDATVQAVYGDILERAAQSVALEGRPHVLLNMVSSADGAISLDGLSGGLSGSADKEVFFYLRSIADVVLVGASTAREENYGQPRLSDELRAQRVSRGQPSLPRIAVVTRSMRIDWSSRLFGDPHSAAGLPLVLCPADTPPGLRAPAEGIAELLPTGGDEVDFPAALRQLATAGARLVLCEGGPTLNGQLLSAGLVDEVCLTVSPVLVGGRGPRISGWDDPQPALGLELVSGCETEGVLMLRYATASASKPASQA